MVVISVKDYSYGIIILVGLKIHCKFVIKTNSPIISIGMIYCSCCRDTINLYKISFA